MAAPAAAPPPGAPLPPPYDGYPPPQLPQPMMPRPMAGPVVRLTTDNMNGRLQVMRMKWTNVCAAPCDLAVDPNGIYRIGGGTVRPSEEFRMPRPQGSVLIETQTGSTVKHWVGFGMILGGLGAVLAGALIYSLAPSENSQTDVFGDVNNTSRNFDHTFGITYIVIGAIVAAVGIPLSMSSTSVEVR
ncbi:MAG TPA: hypothetical protein VK989_12040 [Polyangia bacterium]|nr:hypothetical protein [Polyangia bacterium]